MVVECVDEGRIDECLRPNHGGRLNQEFAHKACDAKANALRRNGKQNVEAPAEVLAVETTLCHDCVGKVANTISDRRVRHDDDQAMFLEVEMAWVQAPLQAESSEGSGGHDLGPAIAKWVSDQLDHDRANGKGGRSERK